MDASYQRLARRQLSEQLAGYVEASRTPPPRDGWIATLRAALDMTVRQLAARLGVSPSSVARLEQRERGDAITLGALRRAADALGCDLVYAVVPRHVPASEPATNLLDSLIKARADQVAAAELSRVAHTMALEDQAVTSFYLNAQIAERATALAETPRHLWEPDDVPATPRSRTRKHRE